MTTCGTCSTSYTGGRAEHCTSCCETFTNTLAGDRHRTGRHGVTAGADRRRCRTEAEMTAAGLVRGSRGYWTRGRGEDMSPSVVNVAETTRVGKRTGTDLGALAAANGTRLAGFAGAAA